jgi:hypothetical protein
MSNSDLPLLQYSDIRESIQDGDILLFKGRGLLSRLISVFTRSEYTHAGIAVWWNERLMVLEAVGKGVWAVPLSWRLATYKGWMYWWTADESKLSEKNIVLDRTGIVSTAKIELGKEYAAWLLVRAARRLVLRVRGGAPDPLRPPDKLLCSQYVSQAYRSGNLDLIDDEPDSFTTPAHLARCQYLRNRGQLYIDVQGEAARYIGPDRPFRPGEPMD